MGRMISEARTGTCRFGMGCGIPPDGIKRMPGFMVKGSPCPSALPHRMWRLLLSLSLFSDSAGRFPEFWQKKPGNREFC